jgi:hypothetical protein
MAVRLLQMGDGGRWCDGEGLGCPDRRRSHRQVDSRDAGAFGLPAGQQALGIVGLNPALQKQSRNRNTRGIGLDALKLHAGKPAAVDGFSYLGAQAPFDARPAFIGNLGHFSFHGPFAPVAGRGDGLIEDGSAPHEDASKPSPDEGEIELSRENERKEELS